MANSKYLVALSFLLFPSAIQAVAVEPQPAALLAARAVGHDALPLITAAPELRHLVKMAGRAVTAAGNTCGFADGNFNDYVSCTANNKCTVSMNGVGCCNAQGCGGYAATCYDYTAIGTTCKTCTRSDAVYCSSKADGWCQTYLYPGGVIDFLCDVAPATIHMLFAATTTYPVQNHDLPIPTMTGVVLTTTKPTSATVISTKSTSAVVLTSSKPTSAATTSAKVNSVTTTSVIASTSAPAVVTVTATPTVKTGSSNPLLDGLVMWKLAAAVLCAFMFLL